MTGSEYIRFLIAQGEHVHQDFKFEISDARKIAKTLSAFANTEGGRLLIGVKDNGKIAGVRSDEEQYMIEAAAHLYCIPPVECKMQVYEVEGRSVLVASVDESTCKPVYAKDENGRKLAYVRMADENILANEVLVLAWKKERSSHGALLKLNKPVKRLLAYLEDNPHISLSRFCKIAHINVFTAKQILSDMISMGALEYIVLDKHILYKVKGDYDFEENIDDD